MVLEELIERLGWLNGTRNSVCNSHSLQPNYTSPSGPYTGFSHSSCIALDWPSDRLTPVSLVAERLKSRIWKPVWEHWEGVTAILTHDGGFS